jgi:hypothetical protein
MMYSAASFVAATLLALAPVANAQWDASRYAWYTGDAGTDFASAVPIGNGRLGAVVFGTGDEKLSLNENSIWSGPWQDRANRNSKNALNSIRQQLMNGDISSAGQAVLQNMAGNPNSPRQYNPLGDLTISFGHGSGRNNFLRYLDTYQGTAFVTYNYNNINYTREYVASYPHGVIAMRISSSQAGQLNAKVSLGRGQYVNSQTASASNGVNSVKLAGNSGQSSGAIQFSSEARVVNNGGSVSSDGKSISVSGATTVDIFFDARTSYRYSSQNDWNTALTNNLNAAVTAGYPAIRAAAIEDNTKLIGRVSLNLGSSGTNGNKDVKARLSSYKSNPNADPQLATLMFNFGRHSLVASSRDTGALSLPANLQGIWNKDFSPAWGSKYTININTEMNYWPAEVTNLAETHKPLFDLIKVAKPRGQVMADIMYGCSNGGFVLHHNIDLWGDAAPVDYGTPYTMWPMGSVWLTLHMVEHYRFTGDRTFLRDEAWPVLQSAAQFYFCYLFNWNNYMTAGPSLSPENPFVVPGDMRTAGRTEGIDISLQMDNSLLTELFTAVIQTCQTLGLTASECSTAQTYLSKIRPPSIGSDGRMMEWRREYGEGEPGHRHMSGIWGLFPGSHFAPLNSSTWAAAARKTIDRRMSNGSGSTGWSRTWVMNLLARSFDGNAVWSSAVAFLQKYPSANLWNTDSGPGSSFQIDGNFGFTSAIAEMLLQSHNVVHLLPALPSAVGTGSVTGLVARGGFVIDITWSGGSLTGASILSRNGGALALRVANNVAFSVDGVRYSNPISTTAGKTYKITLGGGAAPSSDAGQQPPSTSATSRPPTSTTFSSAPAPSTTSGGNGCQAAQWAQCGGEGYTGCKTCAAGFTCKFSNDWYSQCV